MIRHESTVAEGVMESPSKDSFYIFISSRSHDYRYAQQIHTLLSAHNLKSFFAPESIPAVGISEYGHVIDSVLSVVVHLVLVTSRADYVSHDTAPWVHHEWRTFHNLKLSRRTSGNLVTILCGDLQPQELPVPLSTSYQAISFGRIDELLKFMTTVDSAPSNRTDASIGFVAEKQSAAADSTDGGSTERENTPAAMIRMIPPDTPPVPEHSILPKLVEHFAEVFSDPTAALMVLNRANAWRAEADPHKRPRTIIVPPADVPPPTSVSARTFWQNVWSVGRLKGARTVGSLLASAEYEGATYPKGLQNEIGQFVDSLYRM